MDFDSWEPLYVQILEDFGFSRQRDEEAARLLSGLMAKREDHLFKAQILVEGRAVVVCGNAPTLSRDLDDLGKGRKIFIAADGATAVLLSRGVVPEIVVTDLDGPFPAILEASRRGSIIVVHAHGDNLDQVRSCVPQLGQVIGSVQCRPFDLVYNFGGFTDGDRCVFLARHLGAGRIDLTGFDFGDESVTPRKRKKLMWAKRLIDIALA
ncbi:MAG: DUF115 domain-containing protein [Methanotrichaceae archaeon]|nr:DUF115 domain-containing protein [Methanotrichaceae archaeon]